MAYGLPRPKLQATVDIARWIPLLCRIISNIPQSKALSVIENSEPTSSSIPHIPLIPYAWPHDGQSCRSLPNHTVCSPGSYLTHQGSKATHVLAPQSPMSSIYCRPSVTLVGRYVIPVNRIDLIWRIGHSGRSAFWGTNFEAVLRLRLGLTRLRVAWSIRKLVVTGVTTDVCLHSMVR